MKINELHNQPVKADTYEASMALNQLLKIGKHAIKIHNMIDDSAEMESWVAKKIDLAGDYVKKVHGYMQGEKAGLYDDGGLTEDAPFGSGMELLRMAIMKKFISVQEWDLLKHKWKAAAEEVEEKYSDWPEGEGFGSSDHNFAIRDLMTAVGYEFDDKDTSGRFVVTKQPEEIEKAGIKNARMKGVKDPEQDHREISRIMKYEDAGEGHMSKSTLYHTAKYAIELMDTIKPGDDLEGWVQSKLNKAADYLQGVHNYEEYQKLNPYREELDSNVLQKHAQVIQKHIDEILARETSLDDVDTKPGMMRILAKRVNEVEKEIAKEQRKNNEEAPPGREKQVKALKKKFKDKGAPYAIAWAQHNKHGKPKKEGSTIKPYVSMYKGDDGKQVYDVLDKDGKSAYKTSDERLAKHFLSKNYNKLKEAELEEGIKDWAKNLAMAGVIVAGLAGVGSIQDAIDRSVPAVQAMETALELAQDQGNTELADMIKNDLSAVKVRLSSGKDLNFVKGMQEKYSKFIQTEGLAYESKLAVRLEQLIK
jgi:hypothetical protein